MAADRIQFVGQGAQGATVSDMGVCGDDISSAYTVLDSNLPVATQQQQPASTWTFSSDMSEEEQQRIQGMFAMMKQ